MVFAARDINAILDLYKEDARFINLDGSEAHGKKAIKQALHGFFERAGGDGVTTAVTKYVYECGDLAMPSNERVLNTKDANGGPLEMAGKMTEVARKQADRSRLMVLDNPMEAM
ncbi:MAG: YybH family protein [Gammaproteobacteria bacterium]